MTRPTNGKKGGATVRVIRSKATSEPAPITSTPATDPHREAHRAIRATIEREGTEAPKTLYEFFDLFNRVHFDGLLGAPMILVAETSSARAIGDYTPRDVHGIESRIRISPAVFRLGWRQAIATLLHEMVHAYQHEVLGDIERGYKGHGPLFAARANKIGETLGFPRVAYRGRGGLAPAESWPWIPPEDGAIPGPIRGRKAKPKPFPEPAQGDPSTETDDNGSTEETSTDDTEAREQERAAVAAYIAAEAKRVAKVKPKLAASWAHLAERIARAEYRAQEGGSDG